MNERGPSNLTGKLSAEEKLIKAKELKQSGNELYKAKSFRDAMKKYHRALLYIKGIEADASGLAAKFSSSDKFRPVSQDILKETKNVKIDCYNNLAAAALQLDSPNYEKIVTYCQNVIDENRNNSKAWFRQGQAWFKLRDFTRALECFLEAQKLQSQPDPAVLKYIASCKQELVQVKENEKLMYAQMFRTK